MDTVNSFKRKTRKRFVILSVALIFLVVLIVRIIAGLMVYSKNKSNPGEVLTGGVSTAAALKSICSRIEVHMQRYSVPGFVFGELGIVEYIRPGEDFRAFSVGGVGFLEKMSSLPDEYANMKDDPRVIASNGIEDFSKKGELSGSS